MTELILLLTLFSVVLIALAGGLVRFARAIIRRLDRGAATPTELAELRAQVQVLQDHVADLEIENARLREADRFRERLRDPSSPGSRQA